jgi:D-tyrosyl-tRNA(Tyr) deacylase
VIGDKQSEDTMKAVLQRVCEAKVIVAGSTVAKIGRGMLVFLAVEKGDKDEDLAYTARKVSGLRIFSDPEGKMNLSVKDISGEVLVVSQFTLASDCKKGNRPSLDNAEEPGRARQMYLRFVETLRHGGLSVATGTFAADMQVPLVNDGPVTFLLDSRK